MNREDVAHSVNMGQKWHSYMHIHFNIDYYHVVKCQCLCECDVGEMSSKNLLWL